MNQFSLQFSLQFNLLIKLDRMLGLNIKWGRQDILAEFKTRCIPSGTILYKYLSERNNETI